MHYEQHFIDDLKDRADIVRIIEPYAPLKKKGSNWMACCPFHEEKTPSFSVNPAKGFYKCFGCGKGGNVFTFLMEYAGMSFPEAIKSVAQSSGVPLPEPVDDEKYRESRKKREEQKTLAQSSHRIEQDRARFLGKRTSVRRSESHRSPRIFGKPRHFRRSSKAVSYRLFAGFLGCIAFAFAWAKI